MIEHVIDGERTTRLVVDRVRKGIRLPLLRHKARVSLSEMVHG
jgi:hypothetical protein